MFPDRIIVCPLEFMFFPARIIKTMSIHKFRTGSGFPPRKYDTKVKIVMMRFTSFILAV